MILFNLAMEISRLRRRMEGRRRTGYPFRHPIPIRNRQNGIQSVAHWSSAFLNGKEPRRKIYTSSSHSAYAVRISESRRSLRKKSGRSSLQHQPLAGCIHCKPQSQILLYIYNKSHTECDGNCALNCPQHTWQLGIATADKPMSPHKRSTLCLSQSNALRIINTALSVDFTSHPPSIPLPPHSSFQIPTVRTSHFRLIPYCKPVRVIESSGTTVNSGSRRNAR